MFAYSWSDGEYETEQATTLAWQDAACRDGAGTLTDLFFSDEIPEIELAKTICGTCPLTQPCLEGALERREPAGVWGGQLFAEGRVIPRKRKRGRPPKAERLAGPETPSTVVALHLAGSQQVGQRHRADVGQQAAASGRLTA